MSKKMSVCKTCKQEIAISAKICPHCGAKHAAPLYKKWWFWSIIAVVIIGVAGNNSDETDPQNDADVNTHGTETVMTIDLETEYLSAYSTEAITEKIDQAAETVETTTEPTENLTMGQINALGSAKTYLMFSAFSYDGLIEQLEFEKYSHEDAVYAADHCGADWDKQALKSAENYLDFSAFSYEGLIQQLEFEKYTKAQAKYAADHCGADWNEQAAKSAKTYLDFGSFSYENLIEQLEFEGFTNEQAVYGAKANGY